ncbi:MAG: hypothetical protein ACYTG2_08015 [Planctomycetota bacterium]
MRPRSRPRPGALLTELEAVRGQFGGPDAAANAARKAELLTALARTRLMGADAVLRLHEVGCFLRAYPDDARVLLAAERLLEGFEARADLGAVREELENSGVAGTDICYPFFASTAAWLARRYGDRLHVDREAAGASEKERADLEERLDKVLSLVAHWAETPGIDEEDLGLDGWLTRMAGPDTDAALLVKGLDRLTPDGFVKEYLFDQLGLWLRLVPERGPRRARRTGGAGQQGKPALPSRTRAHWPGAPVVFQSGPMQRARPVLPDVLSDRPLRVVDLPEREGAELVTMAREAMVTRSRDLDVFAYGDARDVRLIEWEDGLSFAAMSALPERRLLLESVYGLLTLKNGVPIGYVLYSALFGSSEIAYNVFETYRGGEAGHVYGRVMATAAHLFGSDSFTIYPYQLGDENMEALGSGAWWFYQKLGFRAKDPAVLALMRKELTAMKRRPSHRSSIPTLRRLAKENVYYHAGRERDDVIGLLPMSRLGLAVTDLLASRHGADRAAGTRACEREAAALLSAGTRGAAGGLVPSRLLAGWSREERLAFTRWAPVVLVLPGVAKWPLPERRALLDVIRAKGGPRESDFVHRFDAHRRLRRAVLKLIGTN